MQQSIGFCPKKNSTTGIAIVAVKHFRAFFRCSLALLGSINAAFGLTYYRPVLSSVKNYVFHLFLDQATTSNTYKKMVQKESKLGS